jgi:hypothetical protein
MQGNSNYTNILSIAGAGLLIFLTGICFLIFRDYISRNIRYFLPLPPIGVAAYIYVYNLYQHYNGEISLNIAGTMKEVLVSVAVASVSFGLFAGLLILFIDISKRII